MAKKNKVNPCFLPFLYSFLAITSAVITILLNGFCLIINIIHPSRIVTRPQLEMKNPKYQKFCQYLITNFAISEEVDNHLYLAAKSVELRSSLSFNTFRCWTGINQALTTTSDRYQQHYNSIQNESLCHFLHLVCTNLITFFRLKMTID